MKGKTLESKDLYQLRVQGVGKIISGTSGMMTELVIEKIVSQKIKSLVSKKE